MIIDNLHIKNNTLAIELRDGKTIELSDEGQTCCEDRFMTCDDDLSYYVGSEYYDWELRDGDYDQDDYGGVHQVEFLLVNTSRGTFTIANHNVHNGYYGGFNITENIS